jgi:hypothetical protein
MWLAGVVAGPAIVALAVGWDPGRALLLGVAVAGFLLLGLVGTGRGLRPQERG